MTKVATTDFLAGKADEPPQPPAPSRIKREREHSGMTPKQAGDLVHVSAEMWKKWETGATRMHPAFWELYRIKLDRIRRGNHA